MIIDRDNEEENWFDPVRIGVIVINIIDRVTKLLLSSVGGTVRYGTVGSMHSICVGFVNRVINESI